MQDHGPRLTAADFERLAREAHAASAGLLVRGLAERAGGGLLLLLARPGQEQLDLRLLIVTDPIRTRFHLAPPARPSTRPPPQSAFARDALPYLRDARVRSVAVRPGERLLELRLSRTNLEPPRESEELLLIGELFGGRPNLLLLDGQGIIRALKYARSGRRVAHVGTAYTPPPGRPEQSPESPAPSAPPGLLDAQPDPEDWFADQHPLSAAVHAHYQPLDEAATREELFGEWQRKLTRDLARSQRLLQQLEQQFDDSKFAERQRQVGDLLSAHYSELRTGQRSLEVEDLYLGGMVTLPLDPRLTPRENLEASYRKARKLERTRDSVAERIVVVRQQIERQEQLLGRFIEIHQSGAALDPEAESELSRMGLELNPGRKRPPTQKPDRKRRLPAGIHSFVLKSGLVALVGKSNKDNDELTVRIARGNDLWLHVQEAAGSHVVIRLPSTRTASLEDLTQAAALATHYSKRRGSARADVTYTPRKYVRKSRKLAAGAVILERFKTLTVQDPESVYQALLRSQPSA